MSDAEQRADHDQAGLEAVVHDGARPRCVDGVPSAVASARLARELRREVADLRVRLSEANLRSEALRRAGYPDAAAEVVAEQRVLLDGFRDRLDTAVSAAVVEREAELVLAGELARAQPVTEARRLPAALGAALALAAAFTLAMGSGGTLSSAPLGATAPGADVARPADLPPGSPAGPGVAEDRSAVPSEAPSPRTAAERFDQPTSGGAPETATAEDGSGVEALLRAVDTELDDGVELAEDTLNDAADPVPADPQPSGAPLEAVGDPTEDDGSDARPGGLTSDTADPGMSSSGTD